MFAEVLTAKMAGICELTPGQVSQLAKHYRLLMRWNRTLNLTSIREEEEVVERHYCESLFLAAHLPRGEFSIADVGSGAGFPGFPVAVARPECEVTLIESHQRKAVFLRESSRENPNVRVTAKRAEAVDDRYAWAISRAVNPAGIRRVLERLAGNRAVLAGEEALSGYERVQLPWGRARFLYVSRGTR